jgi:DNA-binding LytR/AlgR family response regulator
MSHDHPDCVFIDDEAFTRESWDVTCRIAGKTALIFASANQLLEAVERLPRSIPIFLDVDLRDDISGEELAVRLHTLGFSALYYATDHDAAFLERPKWLSGIITKDVPNWLLEGRRDPRAS